MSEEEARLSRWMSQAQGGDSDAYRNLLKELAAMLERYAVHALRGSGRGADPALARDLAQEVLLAVHEKRHTYDPERRFLPWVFGIARHKLIDFRRKHLRESRALDTEFDLDTLASPALSDGPGELRALLEQLNPKQREVLELTKLEGLSVTETAARTGLSEANVKVLTHRALKALRKLYEESHEGIK